MSRDVVFTSGDSRFLQEISIGPHWFKADEACLLAYRKRTGEVGRKSRPLEARQVIGAGCSTRARSVRRTRVSPLLISRSKCPAVDDLLYCPPALLKAKLNDYSTRRQCLPVCAMRVHENDPPRLLSSMHCMPSRAWQSMASSPPLSPTDQSFLNLASYRHFHIRQPPRNRQLRTTGS